MEMTWGGLRGKPPWKRQAAAGWGTPKATPGAPSPAASADVAVPLTRCILASLCLLLGALPLGALQKLLHATDSSSRVRIPLLAPVPKPSMVALCRATVAAMDRLGQLRLGDTVLVGDGERVPLLEEISVR